MDDVVIIIPHTSRIGFNNRFTCNGIGDILTVDLRCASGGYLIFDKLYFS